MMPQADGYVVKPRIVTLSASAETLSLQKDWNPG
jgi:hypothetical protein